MTALPRAPGWTKGKWKLLPIRQMTIEGRVHRVVGDDNFPSAFVPAWDRPRPGEVDGSAEAAANAALIAAAPALYETLLAAREDLLKCGFVPPGEQGSGDPEINRIDAALAAAHPEGGK